jgi:ElaB/YqjD/DUF883 family membrane-anchored ribosome-binding protein
MLESDMEAVNNDIKTLIKDAQALFRTAAESTGDKAEEIRERGMHLLNAALGTAQDVQASSIAAGKDMASLVDSYVKENPWRTVATVAGVGLLLGVILGRK